MKEQCYACVSEKALEMVFMITWHAEMSYHNVTVMSYRNTSTLYETVKNVSQVLSGEIINGEILVLEIRTKTRISTIITLSHCCTRDPSQFLCLGTEPKTGQARALSPNCKQDDFRKC